jgi:hypothetical protein
MSAEPAPTSERDPHADSLERDYDPPRLVALGTVEEITRGVTGTHMDATVPGNLS